MNPGDSAVFGTILKIFTLQSSVPAFHHGGHSIAAGWRERRDDHTATLGSCSAGHGSLGMHLRRASMRIGRGHH
jgi:hypothetical protein